MVTLKSLFLPLLWVGLISSDTGAQLCLKVGSDHLRHATGFSWFIAAGYALIFCSFLIWMQILKLMRLSIALSITAILYVTVVTASNWFLGESIDTFVLIGTILIAIGVALQGYNHRSLDVVGTTSSKSL